MAVNGCVEEIVGAFQPPVSHETQNSSRAWDTLEGRPPAKIVVSHEN